MFEWLIVFKIIWKLIREGIIVSLIQHFEADFLWKVSLKILNSGLILKTFTHEQVSEETKKLSLTCISSDETVVQNRFLNSVLPSENKF